jgi:hypothetical protein
MSGDAASASSLLIAAMTVPDEVDVVGGEGIGDDARRSPAAMAVEHGGSGWLSGPASTVGDVDRGGW